jgi:hypothetical protein
MPPTASPFRAWIVLIALVAITFGGTTGASFAFPIASRNDFNAVDWELHHLSGKWLYLGGRLIKGKLPRQTEDAHIALFLDLSARIARLQRTGATDPRTANELADLEKRRHEIENDVEAAIEGRITASLQEAGLASSFPLFPEARWIFPPVDVEFDTPPNELAVSPRDHIELIEHRPLRHDLSAAQIVAIEAAQERDGRLSALIEPIAGAATYPSLVGPDWDYQRLVETVAHEWVHQYLFFHPLGQRFYDSLELRTLNETVATVAGQELGLITVLKYPLLPPYTSAVAARRAPVDVGAMLRQLRLDVDNLLAFGQVDAAEELMANRRQQLANVGVVYRRINQAFFAFRNVYATDPASTDPIGPKIEALRVRTGSIGPFLRAASRLTSESDLDRVLAGG